MVFLRLLLAFAATPFLVNASKYPCSAIEDNVDYHGNDITYTRRVSAEYCCDDCAKTDKCQVFTWTDYEGGTCWLKHSKGEKKYAYGAKSGSIKSDPIPDKCSYFEDNVDYHGNDITYTRRASAEYCCDDCAKTDKCQVFTWTDYEGGTCWLKHSKGEKKYAYGAKSGSIKSEPTSDKCRGIEANFDYPGNDITHTRQVSAEYCCDDCAKTHRCQAFTWTDYEGGTCWLKHSKGEKKLAIGAMSGSIKSDPIPDKCSYIEADVDYPGNDIASTRQAHAVSCCDDCAMNRRCHFFTWTNHEGGTCWLKKSKGKKKYFPGAKSGSIESPPKPEPPCPEPSKPEPPKPEPPCPEPPKPEPPKPEPPCPEPPKPEPPKPEPPAPEPPCIIPNVRKV